MTYNANILLGWNQIVSFYVKPSYLRKQVIVCVVGILQKRFIVLFLNYDKKKVEHPTVSVFLHISKEIVLKYLTLFSRKMSGKMPFLKQKFKIFVFIEWGTKYWNLKYQTCICFVFGLFKKLDKK